MKKKPEMKTAFRLDNNYSNVNDYVREKERCSGYNQAIEESSAYYEELLGGLKEVYIKMLKHKENNPLKALDICDDALNKIESIAKELNWE